jgi:hypothetical protein
MTPEQQARYQKLLRNLIVCTTTACWDLFCKQVKKLNQSDPQDVFRYMLRQAILSFDENVWYQNVEILQHHPMSIPMDTWVAEVGIAGDRICFELTPYYDRLIFMKKNDDEMMGEILRNPVQVAYPECMGKPFVWLPFTAPIAFDGQAQTDLTGLIGGKKK